MIGCIEGTIKIFNITTTKNIYTYKIHSKSVFAISCTPDSKYVVSASKDNTIKLYSLLNKSILYETI